MITRWDLEELYHEDDELMHYGVKGMRWGKHLPGIDALNAAINKARSVATPNNVNKVRNAMNSPSGRFMLSNLPHNNPNGMVREIGKYAGSKLGQYVEKKRRIAEYNKNRMVSNKGSRAATDADSIRSLRRDHDNSLAGKVNKFKNEALKNLRYNVGKAKKTISKYLDKPLTKLKRMRFGSQVKKDMAFTNSGTKGPKNMREYVAQERAKQRKRDMAFTNSGAKGPKTKGEYVAQERKKRTRSEDQRKRDMAFTNSGTKGPKNMRENADREKEKQRKRDMAFTNSGTKGPKNMREYAAREKEKQRKRDMAFTNSGTKGPKNMREYIQTKKDIETIGHNMSKRAAARRKNYYEKGRTMTPEQANRIHNRSMRDLRKMKRLRRKYNASTANKSNRITLDYLNTL